MKEKQIILLPCLCLW